MRKKTDQEKRTDFKIQLPKNALQKVKIGKAFAEYDVIRKTPQLFVTTPATLSALNNDDENCFLGVFTSLD